MATRQSVTAGFGMHLLERLEVHDGKIAIVDPDSGEIITIALDDEQERLRLYHLLGAVFEDFQHRREQQNV